MTFSPGAVSDQAWVCVSPSALFGESAVVSAFAAGFQCGKTISRAGTELFSAWSLPGQKITDLPDGG